MSFVSVVSASVLGTDLHVQQLKLCIKITTKHLKLLREYVAEYLRQNS